MSSALNYISKDTEGRLATLLSKIAEEEEKVESFRTKLAKNEDYDPIIVFRTLAQTNPTKIFPKDIVNFLKDKGIYIEEIEAKFTLFFYDQDHDDSLTYSELFNLLGSKRSGKVNFNKNEKIPLSLSVALRDLLETEIKFSRTIFSILKNLQQTNEFKIHDIFHALKDYVVVTEESLSIFLSNSGRNYTQKNIKLIFNRLDINKDGIIDFCELHAFFGFPDCGYCCPCSPCKNCGAKYCKNCLGNVPCYLLGCDHSGYKSLMECKSAYHSKNGNNFDNLRMIRTDVCNSDFVNEINKEVLKQENLKKQNMLNSLSYRNYKNAINKKYQGIKNNLMTDNEQNKNNFFNNSDYLNYDGRYGNGRLIYEIKTELNLYKPGYVDSFVERLSESLGIRMGYGRNCAFTGCKSDSCPCNPNNTIHHSCKCSLVELKLKKSDKNLESPYKNLESPYSTQQNFNENNEQNFSESNNNFNTQDIITQENNNYEQNNNNFNQDNNIYDQNNNNYDQNNNNYDQNNNNNFDQNVNNNFDQNNVNVNENYEEPEEGNENYNEQEEVNNMKRSTVNNSNNFGSTYANTAIKNNYSNNLNNNKGMNMQGSDDNEGGMQNQNYNIMSENNENYNENANNNMGNNDMGDNNEEEQGNFENYENAENDQNYNDFNVKAVVNLENK